MSAADWVLFLLCAPIVALGLVKLVMIPLSVLFEFRGTERHALRAPIPRVSVVIPARDEESTVGAVVDAVRRAWIDETPLIDELVVIDSDSVDATAQQARAAGATVHAAARVRPDLPPARGNPPLRGQPWRRAGAGPVLCLPGPVVRPAGKHPPGAGIRAAAVRAAA